MNLLGRILGNSIKLRKFVHPYVFDNYCFYYVADFDQFSSSRHFQAAIKQLIQMTLVQKNVEKNSGADGRKCDCDFTITPV